MFWDDEEEWFQGDVLSVDDRGNAHIKYDDDDEEHMDMNDRKNTYQIVSISQSVVCAITDDTIDKTGISAAFLAL